MMSITTTQAMTKILMVTIATTVLTTRLMVTIATIVLTTRLMHIQAQWTVTTPTPTHRNLKTCQLNLQIQSTKWSMTKQILRNFMRISWVILAISREFSKPKKMTCSCMQISIQVMSSAMSTGYRSIEIHTAVSQPIR